MQVKFEKNYIRRLTCISDCDYYACRCFIFILFCISKFSTIGMSNFYNEKKN